MNSVYIPYTDGSLEIHLGTVLLNHLNKVGADRRMVFDPFVLGASDWQALLSELFVLGRFDLVRKLEWYKGAVEQEEAREACVVFARFLINHQQHFDSQGWLDFRFCCFETEEQKIIFEAANKLRMVKFTQWEYTVFLPKTLRVVRENRRHGLTHLFRSYEVVYLEIDGY